MRCLPLFALLPCLACGPRTTKLEDIPVKSASIDSLNFVGIEMMAGVRYGGAELHIVEPDDTTHDLGIGITGAVSGPMMSVVMGMVGTGSTDLDISHVEDPHGDDLLGPYDGFVAEGAVLVGGYWHDLENDKKVRLKLGGADFELGMSMDVGEEWLWLDAAPEQKCHDGTDDDGDGLIDCDDPDCTSSCVESNCFDGTDNDGDGDIDCADSDCADDPACAARPDAGPEDGGVDGGVTSDGGPGDGGTGDGGTAASDGGVDGGA